MRRRSPCSAASSSGPSTTVSTERLALSCCRSSSAARPGHTCSRIRTGVAPRQHPVSRKNHRRPVGPFLPHPGRAPATGGGPECGITAACQRLCRQLLHAAVPDSNATASSAEGTSADHRPAGGSRPPAD
jgi:hypothetical protein